MNDFLLDDDLQIDNGDFGTGKSDGQHTMHIIVAQKGEYKETPELGVGIDKMLNTEEPMEFLIEAKKNLEYDGMSVQDIAFTDDGKLNINAKYKE